MNELTLHPNVYSTGTSKGLVQLLERVWIRGQTLGEGTFYVVSGFGNYNGGVRFYPTFRKHIQSGGNVQAVFAGSTRGRITSKQLVKAMLECGANVKVVNRKRLLHAKCYGANSDTRNSLIVTSGNFTGPGMSQNVEMSLLMDPDSTAAMGFSWQDLYRSMMEQDWQIHTPLLNEPDEPGWNLLYDEHAGDLQLDETNEVTMLLILGHSDTVRINAERNSTEALGTQYFWLSKDCYDFFPPLDIRNRRGVKATYSSLLQLHYVDLGETDHSCRITFEAENNLDFRLRTSNLIYTGIAAEGDLAAITRIGESEYELRIFRVGSPEYTSLSAYAINFIGSRGKRYGFINNPQFRDLLN